MSKKNKWVMSRNSQHRSLREMILNYGYKPGGEARLLNSLEGEVWYIEKEDFEISESVLLGRLLGHNSIMFYSDAEKIDLQKRLIPACLLINAVLAGCPVAGIRGDKVKPQEILKEMLRICRENEK